MTTPCIITVAITGSVARKSHNPAVPETASEQVDSTHEAFEAGVALVQRAADLCADYGRHPASPVEARQILGLRA